jgi:hypothetical protein
LKRRLAEARLRNAVDDGQYLATGHDVSDGDPYFENLAAGGCGQGHLHLHRVEDEKGFAFDCLRPCDSDDFDHRAAHLCRHFNFCHVLSPEELCILQVIRHVPADLISRATEQYNNLP